MKVFAPVIFGGVLDDRIIAPVKAALDFIPYAHYEFHTDVSLACMQNSWAIFHNIKDIFVELSIRDNFTIPKIHSMQHFPDSIPSRGSAAGFNTEGTERLHIDYAKVGYASSNKKRYIKQMTKWLQRQEAVNKFSRYLQWRISGYTAEVEPGNVDPEPPSCLSVAPQQDEDAELAAIDGATIVVAQSGPLHYEVAKCVPADFARTSIDTIETSYGADTFIDCLECFFKERSMCPQNFTVLSEKFITYPVYRRMVINIPPAIDCTKLWTRDPIRATPFKAAHEDKPAVKAHFDTVLACSIIQMLWHGFMSALVDILGRSTLMGAGGFVRHEAVWINFNIMSTKDKQTLLVFPQHQPATSIVSPDNKGVYSDLWCFPFVTPRDASDVDEVLCH
ncbi:hypothetical protein C8J56DRAFT_1170668 [Mycena floridula]|nr:hypothetical protein C8J56DRAFT_1170668 [Mycena floridula]